MFDAILLMAGKGQRTQLGYNKVFYSLNNKPLYTYTLERFLNNSKCNKIIIVVHPDEIEKVSSLKSSKIEITTGGNTRQDSVYNGVKLSKSEIILIHDVARCNVKDQDIINIYEATLKYKASVLSTKVSDTIKIVNNGFVERTLNRNLLYAVQTPQGINRELFLDCLEAAKCDNYQGFDDVELIEKYANIKVKIVEGDKTNIKATTIEDLKLLELLMKEL